VADDGFDSARDELYSVDLDDFTPTRTRLAAAAKEAGSPDTAKRVAGLRKPTRGAWTVNQLARLARAELDELFDLGDALRRAQSALDGPQLRALSAQRRQVVDALVDRALERTGQRNGSEALRAEVRSTLEAALADADVRAEVSAGVLVRAAQWSGFGELSGPSLSIVAPASEPDVPVGKSARGRSADKNGGGKPSVRKPRGKDVDDDNEATEPDRDRPDQQRPEQDQPEQKQPEQTPPKNAAAAKEAEARRRREAAQAETERRERDRAESRRTKARAAVAGADAAVAAAVEVEKGQSRQVRLAQEQLADARRRLDDARLDVRHARSEQVKALKRLRDAQ
jgi:hypothetical protein